MAATHEIVAPGGGTTDITDRIRIADSQFSGVNVTANLDDGSVGSSEVIIDDPEGDLTVTPGHTYRVREGLSTSSDPYLFSGSIGPVKVIRGPYVNGVGRQWKCQVFDGNRALSTYIFHPDESANRPAETAGARATWLLTTDAMANLDDHRYIDTTDTTPMSASDYRRQSAQQVLDDMAQQSGFDYGVIFRGDVDDYAPVYLSPDDDSLDSDIRLTNILSDVTGDGTGNTFAIDDEAEQDMDDSRIASWVLVVGDGIETEANNDDTADEFARRDKVMDAPNVKTMSHLQARARRYASTLNELDVTVACKVWMPSAKASMLKEHFRVQFRASHMPGLTDWTWMRVIICTHEQIAEDDGTVRYLVSVTLAKGPSAPPAPGPLAAVLYLPHTFGSVAAGQVWWAGSGDDPPSGYPPLATTGLLSIITDGSPPNAGWPYSGILIEGDGTISGTLTASAVGVRKRDLSYVVTFAVTLNGAIVASGSLSIAADAAGFANWSGGMTVPFTNIAVANGDVLNAVVVPSPTDFPFFRAPAGTGGVSLGLRVTSGTLV